MCRRIPNIKQLEMKYHHECDEEEAVSNYYPDNLGRFHKLESLNITFGGKLKHWHGFARSLTFPNCLCQLSLMNAPLRCEDMTMIGRIPHLTDLTLICSGFGRKWEPVEGEFRCLKSLRIYGGSLVCWSAERSHFSVLANLSFGGACSLGEIPLDIGEIATLRCISLQSCSITAVVSAVRVAVEQEDLGNEDILLEVEFSDGADEESFMKAVEEEGLSCNNLRVLH